MSEVNQADSRAALLQTLASGAALPDPKEWMARMAADNPTLGALAEYMARRRELEQAEEADAAATAAQEEALAAKVRHALRAMRRKIDTMDVELTALRARNDELAAALGACYLCWGEDPGCPVCGGKGRPGHFAPDRQLFDRHATPAARRLRRPGDHEPKET